MSAKNGKNGNGNGNGNGHDVKPGPVSIAKPFSGRTSKAGKPQGLNASVVALRREEIVRLFLDGVPVEDIAEHLGISEAAVYLHVKRVRLNQIAANQAHFDEQLAIMLDDALNTILSHQRVLADEPFLRSADPERIKSLAVSLGILTDKVFILLAGFKRAKSPTAPPAGDPRPGITAGSGGGETSSGDGGDGPVDGAIADALPGASADQDAGEAV